MCAYFSNGTEGEWYVENWCSKCVHWTEPDDPKQCSVWMLHLLFNGDQHKEGMTDLDVHGPTIKQVLDILIPIEEKIYNGECSQFVHRKDARVIGGEAWCKEFRHKIPMEQRNSDLPCILCMAEDSGVEVAHA